MKKTVLRIVVLFVITSILGSCENNLMLTMPEGPKGDKGDPGASAFDLWKIYYGKDPNISIDEFFQSFKGADGKDAPIPTIGDNGNWWIGDVDTGKPARGASPIIGDNGNWVVDGKDTGVRAEGISAYELWKKSVDEGLMTNKDGSLYTGGNTWTDFTKWLQGGDMSVLHQYWLKQGNEGDINAFLEALFDCHCDGISIIVLATDECVAIDSTGKITKKYEATLKLGGKPGAKFHVTGEGIDMQGSIAAGKTEALFTITRTSEDQRLLINCTLPETTEQISKTANIPSLKYIKLGDNNPVSLKEVTGKEQNVATITFASAPDKLLVNEQEVYTSGAGVVEGTGWVVSNAGKTFTKTYNRDVIARNVNIQAKSLHGECTLLNNIFTIPQLTPVKATLSKFELNGECNLEMVFSGTEGMTVEAKYGNPEVTVTLEETSPGVYSTTAIKRAYSAMNVKIVASKAESGTYEQTLRAEGDKILTAPFTVKWTNLSSKDPRVVAAKDPTNYPYVEGVFTNTVSKPITIEISRPASMPNERFPWMEGNTAKGISKSSITLAVGESKVIVFQRDLTPTFASGFYNVTASTQSQCVQFTADVKKIDNQRDFTHGLRKISNQTDLPNYGGGGGSLPFDPDYKKPTVRDGYTIFEVVVNDAQPGTYVQFLMGSGTGTRSIWGAGKVTDVNGVLKVLVEIENSEIQYADGKKAEFKFYDARLGGKELHSKTIESLVIPK